jgi:hypothetical protein
MNAFLSQIKFLYSALFLKLFLVKKWGLCMIFMMFMFLSHACSKPEVQKSDLIVCKENGIRVEFKGYLFCVYEFSRSISKSQDQTQQDQTQQDQTQQDQVESQGAPPIEVLDMWVDPKDANLFDMKDANLKDANLSDMKVSDMQISDIQISSTNTFEEEVSALCEAPLNYANFEWNNQLYILICSSMSNPPKVVLDAVYQEAKSQVSDQVNQMDQMIKIDQMMKDQMMIENLPDGF